MLIHAKRAIQLIALSQLAAVSAQAGLVITFDYTYDSGFFTSDRKAVLEAAADALESRLLDTLSGINPSAPGAGTWSVNFTNPSTGANTTLSNPTLAPGEVRVYVGAANLPGLAYGGFGGYSWTPGSDSSWGSLVSNRGQTGLPNNDFARWGGSISFDNSGPTWYDDLDISTVDVPAGQYDLYSVAVHELTHILGFGTASLSGDVNSWGSRVSGGQFTGSASKAANGGANVTLYSDSQHWAEGKTSVLPGTSTIQEAAMDPTLATGTRKFLTELDYAGLDDVGWDISAVPEPEALGLVSATGLCLLSWFRRRAHTSRGAD